MIDTTPNPDAFPVMTLIHKGFHVYESSSKGGMSLRDYLASEAMVGLLSKDGHYIQTEHTCNNGWVPSELAKKCFEYADAFLKERLK